MLVLLPEEELQLYASESTHLSSETLEKKNTKARLILPANGAQGNWAQDNWAQGNWYELLVGNLKCHNSLRIRTGLKFLDYYKEVKACVGRRFLVQFSAELN